MGMLFSNQGKGCSRNTWPGKVDLIVSFNKPSGNGSPQTLTAIHPQGQNLPPNVYRVTVPEAYMFITVELERDGNNRLCVVGGPSPEVSLRDGFSFTVAVAEVTAPDTDSFC